MPEGEHGEPLMFPIRIDDDPIITNPELVSLHGTQS
jgi:hypothetical protein